MPYITETVDIDIDVDDFLFDCSEKERNEAVKWLKINNYLTNLELELRPTNSILHENFMEVVAKIANNYYQLTNEEQELIEKISKRL